MGMAFTATQRPLYLFSYNQNPKGGRETGAHLEEAASLTRAAHTVPIPPWTSLDHLQPLVVKWLLQVISNDSK